MSRSFKKTPVFGNTAAVSEKFEKRRWNHRFRRRSKLCLTKDLEFPEKLSAVSEVYSGGKDGKRYRVNYQNQDMRK
jgi:hypothetical protein